MWFIDAARWNILWRSIRYLSVVIYRLIEENGLSSSLEAQAKVDAQQNVPKYCFREKYYDLKTILMKKSYQQRKEDRLWIWRRDTLNMRKRGVPKWNPIKTSILPVAELTATAERCAPWKSHCPEWNNERKIFTKQLWEL